MTVFRHGAERLHGDKRNHQYAFTTKHFKANVELQDFIRWNDLPTNTENVFERSLPKEYLDIVCKFSLFAEFFKLASAELLAHSICDLVLRNWISKTATLIRDGNMICLRLRTELPVYYYRQTHRENKDSPSMLSMLEKFDGEVPLEESVTFLLLHQRLVKFG